MWGARKHGRFDNCSPHPHNNRRLDSRTRTLPLFLVRRTRCHRRNGNQCDASTGLEWKWNGKSCFLFTFHFDLLDSLCSEVHQQPSCLLRIQWLPGRRRTKRESWTCLLVKDCWFRFESERIAMIGRYVPTKNWASIFILFSARQEKPPKLKYCWRTCPFSGEPSKQGFGHLVCTAIHCWASLDSATIPKQYSRGARANFTVLGGQCSLDFMANLSDKWLQLDSHGCGIWFTHNVFNQSKQEHVEFLNEEPWNEWMLLVSC